MFPLLKEAKKISLIILLFSGTIYMLTALLIQSSFLGAYVHFFSFIHSYSYFPTLLFLSIYIALLGFAKNAPEHQEEETHHIPQINIIYGIIGSVVGILLIFFLF